MIVRFLDKKKNCYQLSTPDNAMLIYLTPDERKKLLKNKPGECMMLVDDTLLEDEIVAICEALNTTDSPRVLS